MPLSEMRNQDVRELLLLGRLGLALLRLVGLLHFLLVGLRHAFTGCGSFRRLLLVGRHGLALLSALGLLALDRLCGSIHGLTGLREDNPCRAEHKENGYQNREILL